MNYVPPFDLIWLCMERQQRYIIARWGLCVYQAGPLTLLAYVVGKGALHGRAIARRELPQIERWRLLVLNSKKC